MTNEEVHSERGSSLIASGAKNFILKTRDGTSYFIEADSEADKDNWINWISTNEIVEVAYGVPSR